METYLNVAVRECDGAKVLEIEGELDIVSSPQLNLALQRVNLEAEELILDLGGLGFMDLSGLRVLLRAQERARSTGMRLVLVNVNRAVRRLLILTQAVELLNAIETPE